MIVKSIILSRITTAILLSIVFVSKHVVELINFLHRTQLGDG